MGDFALLELDNQKEILEIACQYKEKNKIEEIIIGVSPQKVTKELLKLWKMNKVDYIELEINSAQLKNLQKDKKGYKELKGIARKIKWKGMKIGLRMPVGLPEISSIEEQNIAKIMLKLKPGLARIYPILVVRNTNLEQEWKKGEYEPLTMTQAVERCKELVYASYKTKVSNICVGIPNEGKIFEGDKKIVAGPFHSELAQMVESSIWYDSVVKNIKQMKTQVKLAKIKVNPEDVDKVIGFDEENIKKLREVYEVDLQVEADETIQQGKSEIIILKTYEDILEEKMK